MLARLLTLLIGIAVSTICSADNKLLKSAMDEYRQGKINQSLNILLNDINNVRQLDTIEKLKSAIILFNGYKLYNDTLRISVQTQKSYLNRLITVQKQDVSEYAPIYLSEIMIYEGEYDSAIKILDHLQRSTTNKDLSMRAGIALSYLKNNTPKKPENINKETFHLIAKLNHAYIENVKNNSNSNRDIGDLNEMYQNVIQLDEKEKYRNLGFLLRITSENRDFKLAKSIFKILTESNTTQIEKVTDKKTLRFFDLSITESLAYFLKVYSRQLFEDLSEDDKFGDTAGFYLSEYDLIDGNKQTAKTQQDNLSRFKRLPKSLTNLLKIRQSGHAYLQGKHIKSHLLWEQTVKNLKNDPQLTADAVLMCLYLNAHCPTIAQTAQLSAENGRSKRFVGLSTVVGRYYLFKNQGTKALRLLEMARDQSDSNELVDNSQTLLINLAEAYRINKNYADSLQILFILAQDFPIVRQIQNAVQGEYIFEQQSPGNTTVF